MMPAYTVVIPARYASTRLPAKPLLDLAGQSMIQRVWGQACQSTAQQVVVATDDARLFDACRAFGAEVVMTRSDHESGTDRLAEVVAQLALPAEALVVNVQGDEPLIPPQVIDQVATNLAQCSGASMATLAEPLVDAAALFNPNVVKVVSDQHGMALTFSRAPLPWARDAFAITPQALPAEIPYRRHVGIYAYRAGFLAQFVAWGACWLEQTERLEQLRALWHGHRIHVADAQQPIPAGVDTLEDVQRVRQLLQAG